MEEIDKIPTISSPSLIRKETGSKISQSETLKGHVITSAILCILIMEVLYSAKKLLQGYEKTICFLTDCSVLLQGPPHTYVLIALSLSE